MTRVPLAAEESPPESLGNDKENGRAVVEEKVIKMTMTKSTRRRLLTSLRLACAEDAMEPCDLLIGILSILVAMNSGGGEVRGGGLGV